MSHVVVGPALRAQLPTRADQCSSPIMDSTQNMTLCNSSIRFKVNPKVGCKFVQQTHPQWNKGWDRFIPIIPNIFSYSRGSFHYCK